MHHDDPQQLRRASSLPHDVGCLRGRAPGALTVPTRARHGPGIGIVELGLQRKCLGRCILELDAKRRVHLGGGWIGRLFRDHVRDRDQGGAFGCERLCCHSTRLGGPGCKHEHRDEDVRYRVLLPGEAEHVGEWLGHDLPGTRLLLHVPRERGRPLLLPRMTNGDVCLMQPMKVRDRPGPSFRDGRRWMMTETTPAQLGKKRTRRSQPRVFRQYGTVKTIETNLGIQIATNSTTNPSKARMALVTLIIAAVFVVSLPAAQAAGVRVGRNIDIRGETGADRQVLETSIAVDPVNPDIIVAGAGDLTLKEGPPWEGYYRSNDGGATWASRLIPGFPGDTSPQGLASPLKQFDGCIDPSLAFDRSENLYFAGSCGKVTPSGAPAFGTFGVFVAKFTGDGAVYSGAIVVEQGHKNPDFPKVAVDTTGGANDGNVYLEYGHDSDGQTLFTRSTDGGQSFSTPIQGPGPGLNHALALDAAGNVYVATAHCTGGGGFLHTCQQPSPAPADVLVAKSTDGGLSFSSPVAAVRITPKPFSFPGNNLGLFTPSVAIAPDRTGVYLVEYDYGT